jgi:hypothetical protein
MTHNIEAKALAPKINNKIIPINIQNGKDHVRSGLFFFCFRVLRLWIEEVVTVLMIY